MSMSTKNGYSLEQAEVELGAILRSACAEGSWGRTWTHELTQVVKNCAVVVANRHPVLQVNPLWLRELAAEGDMYVLADEMRTWFSIQHELARCGHRGRRRGNRSTAA